MNRPELEGLPFNRTECACDADVENCRRPGFLLTEDVDRIVAYLREQGREVDLRKVLRESHRSKVGTYNESGTLVSRVLPTITPKVRNGWCVFLKDRRCSIHPVAPFGCAYFDVHHAHPERVNWAYRRIAADSRYRGIIATLGLDLE